MNREKLILAQKSFLNRYPEGFDSPEMMEIGKKHKLAKMTKMAREGLAPESFDDTDAVLETMRKIVSSSSMVSVFEKPKFRDLLKDLSAGESAELADGLKNALHGDQEKGFRQMISVLLPFKLAKWTLLTVCLVYYRPDEEVFIKPTTVKNVITHFELEGLKYSPTASFEFYNLYREQINQMKSMVDERLKVDNAAFSGFLMMSLGG
ncbi:MAG: hypothetical protein JEZ04_14860 [Spirochaetales bacterium]|nr:hypothetical protein [Spirochaetales bacterium]